MTHEDDAGPPLLATDVSEKVDRVPSVGYDYETLVRHLVDSVGLVGHIGGHRGNDIGTSGVVAVKGSVGLALKRLIGGPDFEIDEGKVAREGDGGIFRRLASVSNHDRRTDPLHLLAESFNHPWVQPETTEPPAWDVELDIGLEQHRISPKQGQDLVRSAVGGEGIDQGAGIALRASRQVIRENVEYDRRSRGARHPSVTFADADIDKRRTGFGNEIPLVPVRI